MALNIENNVEFKFGAGLTSGTLLLTVKSGKETLLPAVPFKLTLVKFDAGGAVTQREIVTVTNKASNVLTITRATEACPKDDSATTLVTVPYDFDEGDSAFITLTADMIKSLESDIALRVLQSEYDAEKNVFSASSVGTDAYKITDASLTAYNDGQPIRIRCDVANTGPATLEINSLGAKALKKNQGTTDLITGDILADGIVTAVYNSVLDVFQFVGQDATVVTTSSENTKSNLIAGGTGSKGDVVSLYNNDNAILNTSSGGLGFGANINPDLIAQIINPTLTQSVSKVKLRLKKIGSPADNLNIRIETVSGGDPTGTLVHANAIGSITGSSLTTSFVEYEITFTGGFTLNNSTDYAIVFGRSGSLDASNSYSADNDTTGIYTNGSATRKLSGTWTALATHDIPFILFDGLVNQSDATDVNKINFIGFADENFTAGNSVKINTSGVDVNQSGLNVGVEYYLSDTVGTISITAGTNSKKCGKAISTTGILINTFA